MTGVGAVTAAGIGFEPFRAALARGETLATPVRDFDASTFPSRLACQVPEFDPKPWVRRRKDIKLLSRDSLLAVGAARNLLDALGDGALPEDLAQVGLFLGVGLEEGDPRELAGPLSVSVDDGHVVPQRLGEEGMGQMNPLASLKTLPNMALGHIAIQCGMRGPNLALSPFDYAGIQALSEAAEAIGRGEIDVAVAGAVDAKVSVFGLTTFSRLGVLADCTKAGEEPAAPFDVRRNGVLAGEAAAILCLEDAERAAARNATVLAEIAGFGFASSPDGVGIAESSEPFQQAMAAALVAAEASSEDVGAVHPCACGSRAGDHAESTGILGALGAKPMLFTSKPVFGETFAASGVLGVLAALEAFARGEVSSPPDFAPDPGLPIRMADPAGSAVEGDVILVNTGSLGGSYATIALRRPQ